MQAGVKGNFSWQNGITFLFLRCKFDTSAAKSNILSCVRFQTTKLIGGSSIKKDLACFVEGWGKKEGQPMKDKK